MPVTKSAKKAARQTRKRTVLNIKKKLALKLAILKLKKNRNQKTLSSIYRLADKLAKTGVIHKNKAKRLKSRAAKKLLKI